MKGLLGLFFRPGRSKQTCKQTRICWLWCSAGIRGDLGVKLNPNIIFSITTSPMVVGGPAQRWGNGNSTLEQANPQWPLSFWLAVGQSLTLHIWKGFVPKQNRQNALNHFSFSLKKQFPTSSTLNNGALILIGGCGCYCNANTCHRWPLRFWHISGTI